MAAVVSRKFIITITLICFSFLSVYAVTFQTPNPTHLTFLGEAHIDNVTSIRLTGDLLVPTSVAGRVLYYKPVTLRDTENQNTTAICFSFLSVYAVTFQTPNPAHLTFLGEAHIYKVRSIRLTGVLLVPTSAAGRVLYYKPVALRDTGNQNTASFNTSFSFSISTLNPNSIGGGLAFVMTNNNKTIGNAGGNMGIFPDDDIAVEFDTFKDIEFNDINGNHVGLNIDSMISKQVFDLDLIGLSLRSGKEVNCWIDYSGSRKQLDVFISNGKTKPMEPVLSEFKIDLYQRFGNNMFVGFSGSTEGSTEIHRIISWNNFTSFFETQSLCPLSSPTRQPMAPIGPPTDPYIPAGPITAATQTKCHGLRCKIIGIAVAIILALVGYWQKDSFRLMFNIFCCSTNHFHISSNPSDEKVEVIEFSVTADV